jgi:hypothetical protein
MWFKQDWFWTKRHFFLQKANVSLFKIKHPRYHHLETY